MPIPPEVMPRARKLKSDAVGIVLASVYARVHRIAHGLAGRPDVGRGIVRYVMSRSIQIMPKWEDETQAEHWFNHFAVLTSRRAIKHKPDAREDLLLLNDPKPDMAYAAFITAVRSLPHQQMEAFILHHGEKLNMRYLAVAMDLSVEAAHNHLRVATGLLRQASVQYFDHYTERLGSAYGRLTPHENLVVPRVKSVIRRTVLPRRIVRAVRNVVILALASVLGYFAWWLYPRIEF